MSLLSDPSRQLLQITGEDSASFLHNIVTQDVLSMQPGDTRFSALLSPQGKWMFDFFIHQRSSHEFLLDIAKETATRLIKGFTMYKLRAQIDFQLKEGFQLHYLPAGSVSSEHSAWLDPRHPSMPQRLWVDGNTAPSGNAISTETYHSTRLECVIPEGTLDCTEKETAMDLSYDALKAISFTKGCYIGQEVTARMHYKSIAKKGLFSVGFEKAPCLTTCPQPIYANGKVVAEMRSISGKKALAFARFDVVKTAQDAGHTFTLENGTPCRLTSPKWQQEKYDLFLKSLQKNA